jgi:hypothetical protein
MGNKRPATSDVMVSVAAKSRTYSDKLPVFGDERSNYPEKSALPGVKSASDAAETPPQACVQPLAFAPTFD